MDRGYRCEDAAASEGHYCGGVQAAFVGAVGVAAYDNQRYTSGYEWQRKQEAGGEAAHSFEGGHGAGEPEKETHLAAYETEIDGGEQKNLWLEKCA